MKSEKEIMQEYDKKFSDLFAEFYEAMKGDVKGCSCERVANILQPGGVSFFVRFNVW